MRQEQREVHRHHTPVATLHLGGSQLRAFAFREEESVRTEREPGEEKGEELTMGFKGFSGSCDLREWSAGRRDGTLLPPGQGIQDPRCRKDRTLVNGAFMVLRGRWWMPLSG